MPSPSRSIQQLVELQNSGSQIYQSNPNAIDSRKPGNETPECAAKWWDVPGLIRQALQLRKAEAGLFEQEVSNFSKVKQRRNDVASETTQHAIELDRVVVDDRRQRRAQKAIFAAGIRQSIQISDGVEIVGLYGDRKVARVQSAFHDQTIREKTVATIRQLLDQQMTELQIAAIGLKYDPAASAEEESR